MIRATTDSPMSPPPLTSIAPALSRQASNRASGIYSTPRSLFDIFVSQDKTKARAEFCGRTNENGIAKLYPNIKSENERHTRGEGMEVE